MPGPIVHAGPIRGFFGWLTLATVSAGDHEHRFGSHLELARLPYFEVVDGRLVVADSSLGPTVDIHTHLALTFGRRRTVDLLGNEGPAEHYLPLERANRSRHLRPIRTSWSRTSRDSPRT